MEKQPIPRDTVETIDTTSKVVSKAMFNGKRKGISLRNVSLAGEQISIAFGTEAKLGSGIVLNQGDVHNESADAGYTMSNAEITAIASVNTAKLAIDELMELN